MSNHAWTGENREIEREREHNIRDIYYFKMHLYLELAVLSLVWLWLICLMLLNFSFKRFHLYKTILKIVVMSVKHKSFELSSKQIYHNMA